jgi:hypothetical protein
MSPARIPSPAPQRPRPITRFAILALTALAAVALFFSTSAAQVPEKARGLKTNQATKRNNGSAGMLTGSVCLFNLFVNDRDSTWTRQERDAVRARMETAADFIALHARKYKKTLTIVQAYKDGLRYEPGLPTDMFVSPAWTEGVLKLTGAASGNELVEQVKKKHQVEHVLLVIHVNKKATSYALSYYDNIDPVYTAERVVCFNRYGDGRQSAAATYAHEILHGFGAGELYFPFDEGDSRKKLGRSLFPDDVMQRVDYDITRLNIGAYTAYRVGWRDSLADEHKVFED